MAFTPKPKGVGTFVGFGDPKWQFQSLPYISVYDMCPGFTRGVAAKIHIYMLQELGHFVDLGDPSVIVPTYLCGGDRYVRGALY